ncbi:TolC family protein [Rurimicrobium arvi]|uniref:TolC family protein n=1 Tax=Rurimicrobium arvi TaxID=2049916 RepID=A0ABP8MQZ8_9BACT
MEYRIIKTAGIIGFLMAGFVAQAQTSRQLSLSEAVKLGVANSKTLKQSAAKIASSEASLRQFKDKRLPSASISGSYLRVTQPTINMLYQSNSASSGSGSGSGSESGSSFPKVDQAMYALGNVSYTLFDGFGNSASVKSAKYLLEATKLDAETDRQQVVQNITLAYSNLYKASRAVDLVKENLKQAQQRTGDFKHLEENGLIARNDLLKAQLQESNVQLSLLDAESDLHVTNLNMNLLLGLPEETVLQLDSNSFATDMDAHSLTYWEDQARNNRSDYKSMDLRVKAAEAHLRSVKSEYYPSLSVTGGYAAINVPKFIQITDAWNAGLGLRYNIGSLWKTGAEVKSAKAQIMQLDATKGLLDDQIKVQLYRSYENYLVALKKLDVLAIAVEQANENYRILKNKYDNSLATATDLLDADVQQLQARLNATYAKADAVVAYNQLMQAAGVIPQ